MGTHFTAIDGILVPHPLFDEGVTGFTLHRFATGLAHQVEGIPGQPRIVDNLAATGLAEELVRQQANNIVTFDKAAAFVEEKQRS